MPAKPASLPRALAFCAFVLVQVVIILYCSGHSSAAFALAVASAGLLVWSYRLRRESLVGPFFFSDLVRLARRGRGTALRFIYGAALLLALGFVYSRHFPGYDLLSLADEHPWVSLRAQASFAQAFATTLLLAQNVAVLVLTPAYLAGAVAEEKEKKTLNILFTTPLTNREILLGKMLGRLAHIGGVLLVALPVLSLAQLWGGVDLAVILAGSAVTALTLFSVGALSLFFSTTANTVASALVGAYAASAVLGLGCLCQGGGYAFSPISFVVELDNRMTHGAEKAAVPRALAQSPAEVALEMVSHYAVVHGGIAVVVVLGTISLLRPLDRPAGLRPDDWSAVPPPVEERPYGPPPDIVAEHDNLYSPSPPVGDDALFWKEVLQGSGLAVPLRSQEVGIPIAVAAIVSVFLWGLTGLAWLSNPGGWEAGQSALLVANVVNLVLRLSSVIFLAGVCAAIAFRAAGTVVRERARRTLDGLLTLPVSRAAILRAKWLGAVLRVRYQLYLMVAGWVIGLCTAAVHPLALVLLLLTVGAHIAFLASLGLWVSLRARTVPWALVSTALVLLLFFGSSWLLWLLPDVLPGEEPSLAEQFVRLGLNPCWAWWTLTFPWLGERPPDAGKLTMLAVAAVGYLAAAAALWGSALRRFRREQSGAA
jgi:ABC-type transport system involved in multi-copper enzyme maturation permease subunit